MHTRKWSSSRCCISVNLFLVAVNPITKCVPAPIKTVGFADDWTLFFRHKDVKFIQDNIQTALNNLSSWSIANGFRFSTEKTVLMHFHRLRPRKTPVIIPHLELNGQTLEAVPTHKILGLKFDEKLEWKSHMTYIKEKVNKRLNLLKALSGLRWGADQDILLRIHQMMVLSVIEYGAAAYSSARPRTLKILDPLHNQGIRLALGAFRSSRIENLLCEAGMTTLQHRRNLITTQTAIKVAASTHHPLKNYLLNMDDDYDKFIQKPTKPFYIRAQDTSATLDINLKDVWANQPSKNPPWVTGRFTLDTSLQRL
jgi:hypothetical protein